jgi:hypothetical protein
VELLLPPRIDRRDGETFRPDVNLSSPPGRPLWRAQVLTQGQGVGNSCKLVLREQRFRFWEEHTLLESHVPFEKRADLQRRVLVPRAAHEAPQTRVIVRCPLGQFGSSSLCQDRQQPSLLGTEVWLQIHFELLPNFARERLDFGRVSCARPPEAPSKYERAVMIVRERLQ